MFYILFCCLLRALIHVLYFTFYSIFTVTDTTTTTVTATAAVNWLYNGLALKLKEVFGMVTNKQTGHKNIREQAASLFTINGHVHGLVKGASPPWNRCSLRNAVIGSYILCLRKCAFCFTYDYFFAYLKPRPRPQPRLQSWLHAPTHICNFEIMSQRLSNWYSFCFILDHL